MCQQIKSIKSNIGKEPLWPALLPMLAGAMILLATMLFIVLLFGSSANGQNIPPTTNQHNPAAFLNVPGKPMAGLVRTNWISVGTTGVVCSNSYYLDNGRIVCGTSTIVK